MKIFFIIILNSFVLIIANGQQSGFRGPERNGIYNEKGLLKIWPSSGPALLWEATEIGRGQSSATVTEDAIYITGRKGDKDVLTSLSQTGKKNWKLYMEIPQQQQIFLKAVVLPHILIIGSS